jgi:hypothetical protein
MKTNKPSDRTAAGMSGHAYSSSSSERVMMLFFCSVLTSDQWFYPHQQCDCLE